MEGAARLIADALREEFSRTTLRKLGYLAARPALLRTRIDPRRQWREHDRIEWDCHQESWRADCWISARHRGRGAGSAQGVPERIANG
jgi:hypothetical protein